MLVLLYFDENGRNHCGSDWTLIFRDLKTVRGVLARINKKDFAKPPRNARAFKIVTHSTWYKWDFEKPLNGVLYTAEVIRS